MVDNEDVIDFSKKKKKKQINLTDLLEPETEDNKDANISKAEPHSTNENDELDLSSLKKKKKKKKTGFSLYEEQQTSKENGAMPTGGAEEELELPLKKKSSKTIQDATGDALDEDLNDLGLDKKKKKSKRPIDDKKVSFLEPGETPEPDAVVFGENTWSDSDRDYTYDELVTRVFDIMRQKNPEMVAGEKKRFIMKPPQCARVGTKKTSFVNFTDICQMLHRQPKHILAFILAELGTSGSVDGNNQLIIKGRFQQKQLESVLRRYIKEYVTCHTCKSPDTILERDVRLYFLRCRVCQSRCSVATIKSGFQAVTNKRARMRAKANS